MQEPQPTSIVPPKTRIPQVSPQYVAANRRVYIAPTLQRCARLPFTLEGTQERAVYNAPRLLRLPISQLSPIQRQYLRRREAYETSRLTRIPVVGQISPAITLPMNLQRPGMRQGVQGVPVTPVIMPGCPFMQRDTEWSPEGGIGEDRLIRPSYPGIPVTPPCSIPGYFVKDKAKRSEPGFGETLMGCGMLLLIGVLVVAVLYYLAT